MEAAAEAARLRLRPILMTSFALILGVFPSVVAAGAGSEMDQALGTAVFAGMIGVTFFGIFSDPGLFSVIMKFFGPKPARARVSPGVRRKEAAKKAGSAVLARGLLDKTIAAYLKKERQDWLLCMLSARHLRMLA